LSLPSFCQLRALDTVASPNCCSPRLFMFFFPTFIKTNPPFFVLNFSSPLLPSPPCCFCGKYFLLFSLFSKVVPSFSFFAISCHRCDVQCKGSYYFSPFFLQFPFPPEFSSPFFPPLPNLLDSQSPPVFRVKFRPVASDTSKLQILLPSPLSSLDSS